MWNVWFQKISIPPPWRELEIPKGRGGGGVKDGGMGVWIIGSFRFNYEYEIEYEYDFRISNQWHFQSPSSLCWF